MYYTGFADEAGDGIETQIEATKALGWSAIEARKIDGAMIHDMPDAAFDVACGKLRDAGVAVNYAEYGRRFMRLVDDVKPRG